MAYKAQNLSKIYQELNKLLITKNNINTEDIENNILPELEESIFQIIDALINLDKKNLFEKINIILEQTNIYAFYNNFIANIRTNLYILKYKNLKLNSKDITTKLNL
jgi:DNA polymerase III gamma/tau subunit